MDRKVGKLPRAGTISAVIIRLQREVWSQLRMLIIILNDVLILTNDRCARYLDGAGTMPRWLGYAWFVWSRRLMHDNLFVYWSVCDVTILCSSFHAITPKPRWLGYAWCVWSWILMHDNLFVYWSVCDVTILRSSFHVDNSNAKMVRLCLIRMIMKVDA